jgi:Phosphofructokinase
LNALTSPAVSGHRGAVEGGRSDRGPGGPQRRVARPAERRAGPLDPEHRFVMVDGSGPAGGEAFESRMPALYGVAYGLGFALKRRGVQGKVGPPRGPLVARRRRHGPGRDPRRRPDGVALEADDRRAGRGDPAEMEEQLAAARSKLAPEVASSLRVEPFEEGDVAQLLHLGYTRRNVPRSSGCSPASLLRVRELTKESVQGILHRGGTILGSSGANPYHEGGIEKGPTDLRRSGARRVDRDRRRGHARRRRAHVRRGHVGHRRAEDHRQRPVGAEACIGFSTAVQIATDAIDRLHSTAESHNRVIVAELMGRNSGWIALSAGLAGGADMILIPERPFDLADLRAHLRRRHLGGHLFSIVVAAEGAQPDEGTMAPVSYPIDERGSPASAGSPT